ncbi:MAG: hypothetical protein JOZ19_14210 [Rubrobacter sp.]|nr:hypothetical protein [Rubrobacter sp.]
MSFWAAGECRRCTGHDEFLDRKAALMLLRGWYTEDKEFIERVRREAQSAESLSHPN